MGYDSGLSENEPCPVKREDLVRWGMDQRKALNLVERSLKGHRVGQERAERKDRWDGAKKRPLREQVISFLESDEISLFSPRIDDSVDINGERVRIRNVDKK